NAIVRSIASGHSETPDSTGSKISNLRPRFILVVDVQGVRIIVSVEDQQPGNSLSTAIRANAESVAANPAINRSGSAGKGLLHRGAVGAAAEVKRDGCAAVGPAGLLNIEGNSAATTNIQSIGSHRHR